MKVDIGVFSNAVDTLKAASELAASAKEIDDIPAFKKRLADMSSQLLAGYSAAVSAQAQLMGMMQENFELQARLSKVEQWANVANRYRLVDFGGNTFAYQLKAELRDDEPDHLLCPNCFQGQRKSLLQFSHNTPAHQRIFDCHACSKGFALGTRTEPDYRRSSKSSGWAV